VWCIAALLGAVTEIVTRRFGVSVAQVFPGFAPQAVGVMA